MASDSGTAVERQTAVATTPDGGKLIQSTTSTTTSTAVPVNYGPGALAKGVGEWAALVVGLAILAGMVTKWITMSVTRDIRDHGKRLDEIEEEAEQFRPKEALEADRRAIEKKIDEQKHRLGNDITNAIARIHQLEQGRIADVERIVRLETNLVNIEKGQERLQNAVDRNHRETLDAMKVWADQFSASIREIRSVGPKG